MPRFLVVGKSADSADVEVTPGVELTPSVLRRGKSGRPRAKSGPTEALRRRVVRFLSSPVAKSVVVAVVAGVPFQARAPAGTEAQNTNAEYQFAT